MGWAAWHAGGGAVPVSSTSHWQQPARTLEHHPVQTPGPGPRGVEEHCGRLTQAVHWALTIG